MSKVMTFEEAVALGLMERVTERNEARKWQRSSKTRNNHNGCSSTNSNDLRYSDKTFSSVL